MSTAIELTTQEERETIAKAALGDAAVMQTLLDLLADGSRSKRQRAASALAIAANVDAEKIAPHAGAIVEALQHPEAQTRWECLNILCILIKNGKVMDESVLAEAEESLFDEKSGIVREAAFRYYCLYGATSAKASDAAWPNLDEAIQCHHGNAEFNDELTNLVAFAEGQISEQTASSLASRMKFDSENAKGTLRMRSEQIVKACAGK